MANSETKRDELKNAVSQKALKYGAAKDNHALGLEYLALEILAHQPSIVDEFIGLDSSEIDVRAFHTGGPNDGGIDGILFNEEATNVFITQTKYKSGSLDATTLEEARSFFGRLDEWMNPANRLVWNSETRRLLDEAELAPNEQEISLYFFTTMTSVDKPLYQNIAEEFTNLYRERNMNVRCEMLTQSDILDLMRNSYNTQEHSLVPNVEFKISRKNQFIFNDGAYRVLVGAMSGNEIANLYNRKGVKNKLFNLNVRAALLASGKINTKIRETAQDENEAGNFFYYNNGITATCSNFDLDDVNVSADNMQVVNGAQTVAALADAAKANKCRSDVYVMFRLIETEGGKRKNQVADQITRFQNTQNPVKVSDFFSNEPIHKKIEMVFTERSGRGAFPSVWYEYKRGIKSAGTAGRKKITQENLAYLRYACLSDAPFTYKNAKDIWDGVENNKLFWTAFGVEGEEVQEWDSENIAQVGWMLRCWLQLRDEQKKIAKDDSTASKNNKERIYLGVMARYITALAFSGMCYLRDEKEAFSNFHQLMESEPFCKEQEKKVIRVARRIVRNEFSRKWDGQVANPRLNMPQNAATWEELKSELKTEYELDD
ncbi:MAG: hypothetical protein RL437_620 [Actinomycetota bacterium]|jgi:hypothetical protein